MSDVRISALVVLRSATAGMDEAPITSETVASHLPSENAIRTTAGYFSGAGFEVGDVVGISFSVSGPPELFAHVFGQRVDLRAGRAGRIESAATESGSLEFDLGSLPPEVAEHVRAVTFTPPPDFGPGNP